MSYCAFLSGDCDMGFIELGVHWLVFGLGFYLAPSGQDGPLPKIRTTAILIALISWAGLAIHHPHTACTEALAPAAIHRSSTMCWHAQVIRDYTLLSDHFPLSPRPWSPDRGLSRSRRFILHGKRSRPTSATMCKRSPQPV
jgi:hypothetical protein